MLRVYKGVHHQRLAATASADESDDARFSEKRQRFLLMGKKGFKHNVQLRALAAIVVSIAAP